MKEEERYVYKNGKKLRKVLYYKDDPPSNKEDSISQQGFNNNMQQTSYPCNNQVMPQQVLYPYNNQVMFQQVSYPYNNQVMGQNVQKQPTEKEMLEGIKKLPLLEIIKTLNEIMLYISIGLNQNNTGIFNTPYLDPEKGINLLKGILDSYEFKEKIEDLLLGSNFIKTIDSDIYSNFNEYGYWENLEKKTEVDKIKKYQDMISVSIIIATSGKMVINWSDDNTLQKIFSNFFKKIEADIKLNPKFIFNNNGKSLKQLNRETSWINFKNYIVNYKTLEVLKKEIVEIEKDIKVAVGFTKDGQRVLFDNMQEFAFDSYINTDPIVDCENNKFKLVNEDNIDTEILDYLCETMFGNNYEKVRVLLQHIGYCLSPNKDKKKSLFVIGPANIGKSRIADLIASLFPSNLIVKCKIKQLNSDGARAKLMKSKVNIGNESNDTPTNLDTFKTIVSGETQSYNLFGKLVEDDYNIGLVFLANEFIKPLNKSERRDSPTGYLDKFSILPIKKLSKAEKYKITFEKEEFKQIMVSENTKQIFTTMALYELKYLYENDFEFIETQDEIKEKRRHTYNWCKNELKRKRSIEDLIEEFEGYEYSPFESDDIVEGEFQDVDSQETDFTNSNVNINQRQLTTKLDMYSMNSFINDKVEFQDLDLDIAELSSLEFEKIHSKIFKLYKDSRVLNDSIFEKYISYVGENNNRFENTKAFVEEFQNELEKRKEVGIINIVKYKKASTSEKKKFGEKDKEIILNVLENRGYLLLYKEIGYKKEDGKSGTKTAFCGLKLK